MYTLFYVKYIFFKLTLIFKKRQLYQSALEPYRTFLNTLHVLCCRLLNFVCQNKSQLYTGSTLNKNAACGLDLIIRTRSRTSITPTLGNKTRVFSNLHPLTRVNESMQSDELVFFDTRHPFFAECSDNL